MKGISRRFFLFDTCKSIFNCLNESFYQSNSTMFVHWSFNYTNIIFVSEGLYLIANQTFCLIQSNRSLNSVISKFTCCWRSCGLFALRNCTWFLLLVSNSKKVGNLRDSSSHRAWNIRPWGDPAARITLAMLHFLISILFPRELFNMALNELVHQFFSGSWSPAVRVYL